MVVRNESYDRQTAHYDGNGEPGTEAPWSLGSRFLFPGAREARRRFPIPYSRFPTEQVSASATAMATD
jgi:hypothetical protein